MSGLSGIVLLSLDPLAFRNSTYHAGQLCGSTWKHFESSLSRFYARMRIIATARADSASNSPTTAEIRNLTFKSLLRTAMGMSSSWASATLAIAAEAG